MADITEERLRKILERKLYFGLDEGQAIAAELLAARARIAKLEHEPPHLPDHVRAIVQERDAARAEVAAVEAAICDRGVSERDCGLPLAERVDHILLDLKQCRFDLAAAEMENTKLRAQLHADDQRAWEALGKPEGTHDTTNVQRLCAEVERLRGEVDRIKADQCSLLRIIGDSFLHLHIPHSAMAFDGRNLTPHAEESARASEIYRAERDAARAEVASLREGQEELARAVKFLDMCNKERIASGDTGAMSDAWQCVEEAAREMIDAAKETP